MPGDSFTKGFVGGVVLGEIEWILGCVAMGWRWMLGKSTERPDAREVTERSFRRFWIAPALQLLLSVAACEGP